MKLLYKKLTNTSVRWYIGKYRILSLKRKDYCNNLMDMIAHSLIDPKGIGHLNLQMHLARIKPKYQFIFYKMRTGHICIDCGAHAGIITDIYRHQDAEVYSFEPNLDLFTILERKYQTDNKVHLYNQAVWDKNTTMELHHYPEENSNFFNDTQEATLIETLYEKSNSQANQVEVIDLVFFIKDNFIAKNMRIYFLKLNIQGAEFEILEKIIQEEIYTHIDYIMCETHERFFEDGQEKIDKIKKQLEEKKITNIYLDWV